MIIDNWEAGDAGFRFELDGNPFSIWSSVADAGVATTNGCGGAANDLGIIKVRASIDHSGSSLELNLYSLMDENANNESWGVRDLKMTFLTSSESETTCGSVI